MTAVVDAVAAGTGGPVALWGHSYGANCAAALTNKVHHLVLYEPSLGLAYPAGSIEVEEAPAAGDRGGHRPRVRETSGSPRRGNRLPMTTEGLVALVFTDLVGSTELPDRPGNDAGEELRRTHLSLSEQAVTASGGAEVKYLADGASGGSSLQ